MKMQFFVLLTVSLTQMAVADVGSRPLGESGEPLQKLRFKQPLTIPFSLLSKDEQEALRNSKDGFDHLIIAIFVGGKMIRAESANSVFKGPVRDSDFLLSDRQAAISAANPAPVITNADWDKMDVNYCSAYLFPTGTENKLGFEVKVDREIHPYLDKQKALRINWGDLIESQYNMLVDLNENERPNPQTIRTASDQIPKVTCIRHAHTSEATRVTDFIKTIGADNVEIVGDSQP